ncbi:MAG: NADH-quinone oxidoreductase subunit H [Lachnospiraceae bacterium]|jgi:ech hydrogenase subunit B|nr:NADH-quinone oxidoreductase subunit H [Lachnospiraceae bacterium]MBQ5376620.1 NADH-quinone oxidoreductase subunit H [Lachnospiraceae bacterium]MCR5321246.1 NADH-quinone oxidoreductase subunit H [Lachnospiraceae bacterium]
MTVFSWQVALAYIILAPFIGGFMTGLDRKISARMQGRRGPSVLQPFYDVSKLMQKETKMVNHLQQFMVSGFLVFVAFTGALFFWGGDLLLVFFSLTLAGIFYVLTASCANAPFSSLAAQRELLQMMAYEPMVLLAAIGFYLATGSFQVREIAATSMSGIVVLPGFFLGFVFILTIKLRKSPFDLSTGQHAHQEIVQGLNSDLSGFVMGLVEIAHWYENVFLFGVIGLFILNGQVWSIPVALLVCFLVYFLEILVDNVCARVKWKLLFQSAWIVTACTGVINLMILSIVHLAK